MRAAVVLFLVGDKRKQVQSRNYNNLVYRFLTQPIRNIKKFQAEKITSKLKMNRFSEVERLTKLDLPHRAEDS